MQIESSVNIRELLWEWSRAYPERPGDCVNWYRKSSFADQVIADQYPESPSPPIDYERADRTNAAVQIYINGLRTYPGAKSVFEEGIFDLRYHRRWELPDIAKLVRKSIPWVKTTCNRIEGRVETALSVVPEDLTDIRDMDIFRQAAVLTL